jgi:serine/threonine protein kinase/tetratricopeptide (TPR) repeat protein
VPLSNDDSTHVAAGAADTSAGILVGPYRLIREIGRGGMGTVYLAVRNDDVFQKRVAIKILDRGAHNAGVLGRFRTERQILASLEHPYIAGLLDGGTTADGAPYFAMEYVDGQPISDYCDSRQLDTTERLQLFRKVCAAVQYAHQNLIIHRDIKPGNVLVTGDGTPKLLDFGIAKLLNPELGGHALAPTMMGALLMTPEYASPEQVRGETVTTATDVYSLGVLLYELLTGQPPYRLESRAPAEVARVVCESVPVRPSTVVTTIRYVPDANAVTEAQDAPSDRPRAYTGPRTAVDTERLRRRLAGDLDNIVLKALSKEPTRRYASADQFSEDIDRHLRGLPVIARKDTLGYRTSKFVQRNRAAVITAVVTFITLIAGIVGTAWQARVARAERARAEQRFDEVRRLANASLFDIHDAIRDLPGSTPARQLLVANGLTYLDQLARDAGDRPDLMRELANAYVKVGDVQGRPLNPNLGDTAGALTSYRKAASIYESLAAKGHDSPTLGRELATAYLRLSEVLGRTGETAEAMSLARKGAERLERAAAATPATDAKAQVELRRELAASHSRLGDLLSAEGDTKGAIEQHRLALALMDSMNGAMPTDISTLRQLGVAHQKLANSLGNPNYPNIGDYTGALEQLQLSGDVFRKAIATYPTNALFRRLLAVVDSNTADVLQALKRPDEALATQRRALTAFQALAAADPRNAAANNDVAISQSKIAEMLYNAGRSKEAVPEFERALAMHQNLAAADPTNASLKLEVASDYNRLATAQAQLKDRAAIANHDRAVAMTRALRAENTGNTELTVAFALALAGRGDAHVLFAELPAAERDYVESVGLLEKLEREGAIHGTDAETLENNRKELARIRRLLNNGRSDP